jgi:hypothetical protein
VGRNGKITSFARREPFGKGKVDEPVLLQCFAVSLDSSFTRKGRPLNAPDGFTMDGTRGFYRPAGVVSFDECVIRVRAAIAAARTHRAEDLLVDTTALNGFLPPDAFERFNAVTAWADEAEGQLRLALVARAEMIDPNKVGLLVANYRGLVSNIFTTEPAARAWLDAERLRRITPTTAT